MAEGKESEAGAEPIYPSGKRDELGTLSSREVCEWPLWMGTKWPEKQRVWKEGRGKRGVDRPEVDALQGCGRGRLGKKARIWEYRCEQGLNQHNLWEVRVDFACVSPGHQGK